MKLIVPATNERNYTFNEPIVSDRNSVNILKMKNGHSSAERAVPQTIEKVDYVQLILNDIGGTFKRYQIFNYILFCIPFALSGSFGLSYVFTALNLDYRCHIDECETFGAETYEPNWLPNAVPYQHGTPSNCLRFQYIPLSMPNDTTTSLMSSPTGYNGADHEVCSANRFNRTKKNRCVENQFVYKTDELTIMNEYNLTCDENSWKLAMVGTVNNIGRFIFTPFMGVLSDRFGRRTVLVVGVLGSSIFALVRSYATNYLMFLTFEFLDAAIGTVTYSASFILAMEWIGVKDRVLLGSVITATYPFGQIFLGLVARYTRNFRHLIRIIYAPGFLIIAYLWIAPESIRWLIVNGKRQQTLDTLKRAERINRVKISPNTLHVINEQLDRRISDSLGTESQIQTESTGRLICKIFTHRIFLIRMMICLFVWIANAFISYGISLTSVSLAGDKYINFIVIAMAGIPAMLICYIMMEKCGRRWTLCSSLIIGGASIVASKIISPDSMAISISLFFIGKCFITVSFTGLYVYTSELWPTHLRHSIMGLCSTAGRLGAMFAPLAPLLSQYSIILPYLMFGSMAFVAGVLILQLPETLNRKLPDTLEEAEQIKGDDCNRRTT